MGTQLSLSSYRGFLFAGWNGGLSRGSRAYVDPIDDRLYYGQFNTASRDWAHIRPSAAILPGNGSGPSLCSDGVTLFAGWKDGLSGDAGQLYFSMMFSTGLGWSAPTEIAGAVSVCAPTLAVAGKTLVAAWVSAEPSATGAGGAAGNSILYSTAAIRQGFAVGCTAFPEPSYARPTATSIPGAYSSESPALALSEDGQRLFAAWIGPTDHTCCVARGAVNELAQIWHAAYSPSEGWSTPAPLSIASASSPALACYQGDIWMVWQDFHDRGLRIQKLRCLVAGATGVAILPESGAIDSAPAIAECDGKLYAMGRSAADGSLSLACLDGETWTALGAAPNYC